MNENFNSHTNEVTIIVATWNSEKFLADLFQSFNNQSYKNTKTIVIDNGSLDGTCEFIEKNYPLVQLSKNKENVGFAKAYNQGIRQAKTPYVLVCNHDIILDSNFISQALKVAKSDERIGAVGGKLLKLDPDLNKSSDSVTIDSTGIVIFKSRRAIDRGENEKDEGQFDRKKEVFGISGALALYQKNALEKIAVDGEYFDEDFFAYKEDIDLAWRLRAADFKSIYIPSALAYHKRKISRRTDLSDKGTILNRQRKTRKANYLSYRNHLFVLVKNESFTNLCINPPFSWYELKKLFYIFFQEPTTLKALVDFFKKLPVMLKKRRKIKEKRKISPNELNKWFV